MRDATGAQSEIYICQITPVPDSAAVVPDRLTLVDLRRIVVRSRLIIDLCLVIHK